MPSSTRFIARLSVLVALTIALQMAGFPQPITGPLVNFMLFITTQFSGMIAGILLGMLTPVVALWRGQLPPLLAPMIPFIIMGNAVLVVTFGVIKGQYRSFLRLASSWGKGGSIIAVIAAALTKFLFLMASVKLLLPVVFGHHIPDEFAFMMMTPQLLTALAGGIAAMVMIEPLSRIGFFSWLTKEEV